MAVLRIITLAILTDARREIAAERDEHGQGGDLERQASDHDINPTLRAGRGNRGSRQTPSSCLEEEGKKVEADEGNRVGAGTEAGKMRAVDGDDAGEAEVNCGGEEARGDGNTDEIAVCYVVRERSNCFDGMKRCAGLTRLTLRMG